ncbi:hypothetical protein [Streptomyces sp. NPDC058718]|uniref:hypothetical protein n=1 Tax=Streptomyces sp. NPDC058718 TaxID=3346610 RepID=UPI0036B6F8BC
MAVSAPRPVTPQDAAEIVRLRSDLILSEPLDEQWLAGDPALMRMTKIRQAEGVEFRR